MSIKQVLWDWNGTLLDDLAYGMGVRNRTFPIFGLPTIDSVEAYHEQFTFPIRIYYERGGVTEENFEAVAHAWMDEYIRGCKTIPLHADVIAVLQKLKDAGLTQVVLSASKLDVLREQLGYYPLEGYFDRVLGLGDIYARSKVAVGKAYLESCQIPQTETVMVGDTLHDAQVAQELGTHCVLVARGHQSKKTLLEAGVPVMDTLEEAFDWIKQQNQ